MFTITEINNFKTTLRSTLRTSVESGNRVLPSGFAFYRVSPKTQLPNKSVGSCYAEGLFEPSDVDHMAEMIQSMARAGHAHAAGMAVVAACSLLPEPTMFLTDAESVAVIYLDNIQGAYEVWYAPVLNRTKQTPTLGDFQQASDMDGRVPYLLPMDLYGPTVGQA